MQVKSELKQAKKKSPNICLNLKHKSILEDGLGFVNYFLN